MAEMSYRITTPSADERHTTQYAPEGGIMNSAIIHFPGGCDQYLEVLIFQGTNQILPTPTRGQGQVGIALEDTTQSFNINKPVEKDDALQVTTLNHDGAFEHTISVVILILEQERYTGP